MARRHLVLVITSLCFFIACKTDESSISVEGDKCDSSSGFLQVIQTEETTYYLFENGKLYSFIDGECQFVDQYFEPGYPTDYYTTNSSGTFLNVDDGQLFPTKTAYVEEFEETADFLSLFPKDLSETDKFWSAFTLQSVATPTVDEYVELRQCIMNLNCTFIDHTITLAEDPTVSGNQVLRFYALSPSSDMVTAKTSLISSFSYFTKNDDFWFESKYFIEEGGVPYSIADFESSYFLGSPGPRIVISNNKLAIENKFGLKTIYRQENPIDIPFEQWFTVKTHLRYDDEAGGIIQLWQDGNLIIDESGINLPIFNAIQNRIEVGITATSNECVMYMDDVIVSSTEF